jgi:hypothetical protein
MQIKIFAPVDIKVIDRIYCDATCEGYFEVFENWCNIWTSVLVENPKGKVLRCSKCMYATIVKKEW